jgi:hypothetical protein
MEQTMSEALGWGIFRGTGRVTEPAPDIPLPPSWRRFGSIEDAPPVPAMAGRADLARLGAGSGARAVRMVNAAIILRRPLLVTGQPGSGKSTLARLIAHELGLGPVLHWPITSSARLRAGLYAYDAIGRVHDENHPPAAGARLDIGRYLRLGPLGTALLPWNRPRVLLVDEIDKSDIDLPNDLLHVFEEGTFTIPELERLPDGPPISVLTADRGASAEITGGQVTCAQFPVVVLTSNEERTFPPAFLRRCLRLDLQRPDPEQLRDIVANRIGDAPMVGELIDRFVRAQEYGMLATDQLLNAIFAVAPLDPSGPEWQGVVDALLADLATG